MLKAVKKMGLKQLPIITVLVLTTLTGHGQNGRLTLEDIYMNQTYSAARFGPVKWYKNGAGYTSVEPAAKSPGEDIVLYETKSGERTILVAASQLVPKGKESPLRISNYQFSADGNYMMVFTNTRKVWRNNTRGDYWLLDIRSSKMKQLGGDLPSSSLMFAKFSPDSKKIAYVSEKNIYVEDIAAGDIVQLTFDGKGNIINGTTDWAYEEEFGLSDAFRWSPDSKKIAFWQINTEGVGIFTMINNLDSNYPETIPFAYPKVGTTNPEAKTGVINLSDRQIIWIKTEGDSRDNYLPRMEWRPASDELVIQQINRNQNINRVILANAETGSTRVVFKEETASWTEAIDDLTWVNEGNQFTWKSDMSGWLHLYLVSSDGKKMQQITDGNFEVIQSMGIDEKTGYAYFMASPDKPTQRYLYRSKTDGKGLPEKLSPENQSGHHYYDFSPDKQYAIHTFSNHNTPPVIEIVRLKDHKLIRTLEDNQVLKEKFANLNIRLKEFFRVPAEDGLMLDAYIVKPPDFDPEKKYPVIFYVYGEPAGTTVQDRWSGSDLWDYFLSQQGYVVISVDNRGTNVPRGREWKESIYRKIGIVAPFDQAAAARYIMQKWSFIDQDRIGIWGWSGGGSMTLNCMFRFPEIYKTGVAIAFVSDQKLYDSFYQERYMGQLKDNESGYRDGSPITHSGGLEGNLLLIYGSGDDNCHYQNLEILADKLIKENKYFTMIEYPMRTHAIAEREGSTIHLRTSVYRYFLQNLPPGAK